MIEDYNKARKIGLKTLRRDASKGGSYLPALDEKLEEYGQEITLGLVEIPIPSIVGTKTKGRQNSFAADFMPLLDPDSEFATKWSNLCDSAMEEGIREQIIVYEYMRRFYVQEGNKRVSVSRYLGIEEILAHVTRILPKRDGSEEVDVYYEFVDFYQVCPIYDIAFSKKGEYERLAKMMGEDLSHAWSRDRIRDLAFAFHEFEKHFYEKGGQKLDMTAGDAFLVYMNVYGIDSLLSESSAVLDRQIKKVWNEILLAAKGDTVSLVESPGMAPRESNPFSAIVQQAQSKVYTKEDPLRVAFIYGNQSDHSAWVYGHELGRQDLANRFQGAVETIKFENCFTDEEIRHAIDIAGIDEDAVIFTTSTTQMPETLKSAIHYPEIQFLNCSVNLSHNAVQTYAARMYEAKFLMGALAGSLTKNDRLGYLASYPVYGVLADINAFAMGAAMVNPDCKVHLSWSGVANHNWAEEFRREGIRIISGPDLIQPDQASREYGVYRVEEDGSVTNLAFPVINWGKYYEDILRPIVEGLSPVKMQVARDQSINYWWGMSSGAIDIILGNKVSYYSKKMIEALKQGIISGRLHPFDGELRSQQGVRKPEGSPRLSNQEIITMDYLADNIVGHIPSYEELTPRGKQTVQISGIPELKKGTPTL